MIGLDTNVLVRFLMEDDVEQSGAATAWIRKAGEKKEKLFLSHVVLSELVWVLAGSYRLSKARIADVVESLISAQQVEMEDYETVRHALHDYALSSCGFADCLIRRKAMAQGCSDFKTFDGKLSKVGFA